MIRRFAWGAAAGALVACNVITGSVDLAVCEGTICTDGGPGGGDGGGSPSGRDGGGEVPRDSGITAQPCDPGASRRCDGRASATCVDGKWSTSLCPETCLEGVCAPWPSCRSTLDDGARCGKEKVSCCESKPLPGGTFNRRNSASLEATVGPFDLDTFEVTVGRFRLFVDAGAGTRAKPPGERSGAHPRIPGSGWLASWNALLPVDSGALRSMLGGGTWTNERGANEQKPITNVSWHVAFAFCAWDGGRLPTYAEWTFAASGGSEQRFYPWSSPASNVAIEPRHAAFNCSFTLPALTCPPPKCTANDASPCNATECTALGGTCQAQPCFGCDFGKDVAPVGSLPDGTSRWGQLDLAGNAAEYVLDAILKGTRPEIPATCVDCAPLMGADPTGSAQGGNDDYETFIVGGTWSDGSGSLQNSAYDVERFSERSSARGFRCARD